MMINELSSFITDQLKSTLLKLVHFGFDYYSHKNQERSAMRVKYDAPNGDKFSFKVVVYWKSLKLLLYADDDNDYYEQQFNLETLNGILVLDDADSPKFVQFLNRYVYHFDDYINGRINNEV